MLISKSKGSTTYRIWIDELPKVQYHPSSIQSYTLNASSPPNTENRIAAVEIKRIVGPMTQYGLLGATYIPNQLSILELKIGINDSELTEFNESLVHATDTTFSGLPSEYSSGVLEGLQKIHQPMAGEITIVHACHSQLGSSRKIFERVAQILIKILFNETTWIFKEILDGEILS